MSYYFKKNTAKSERKLFPKIILNDLRLFPIKNLSKKSQKPFIILSECMLAKNEKLYEKSQHFINLLKAEYETIEISGKLNNWYELDWKQFTNELKKQKIVLSGSQKDDWFERFNRISAEIKELQKTIDETDKQIDSLIYKLYNLTDDEIQIIEEKY